MPERELCLKGRENDQIDVNVPIDGPNKGHWLAPLPVLLPSCPPPPSDPPPSPQAHLFPRERFHAVDTNLDELEVPEREEGGSAHTHTPVNERASPQRYSSWANTSLLKRIHFLSSGSRTTLQIHTFSKASLPHRHVHTLQISTADPYRTSTPSLSELGVKHHLADLGEGLLTAVAPGGVPAQQHSVASM